MNRGKQLLIPAILLAVLASTFLISGAAHAAPVHTVTPTTCNQWNYVSSPSPSIYGNLLNSVAAISASDVWAVGGQDNNISNNLTLAEHYDGSAWSVVSVPEPTGSVEEYLLSIAAVSTSDVWTAGYYFDNNYLAHTLIEQWNGSAWSIIPSPNVSGQSNGFNGVTAISSTAVRAVGIESTSTLVEKVKPRPCS